MGSGSLYNGELLAGMHNVVIVTINYRLGILGFFNIPGTTTKGNYGLMDQILALKWVKQHIGDFGGDANKVTIFGESAGAGSVSLLILSPLTKGLFSKAIAQSGSAFNFWAAYQNTNTSKAASFAQGMGCKDLQTATDCLKKKSYQEILKLQKVHAMDFNIYSPNVDKHVISGLPNKQLKEGKLPVSNVDLMIGFNTDEGSMFVPNVTQWNKTVYEKEMRGFLVNRYGHDNELETKLASFYYRSFKRPDSMDFPMGFKAFADDYMFKEGIVKQAMEWSKKNRNTYLYHFGYLPKHLTRPGWGVAHAMDLNFVFGIAFRNPLNYTFLAFNFTDEDREVSSKMMKMWTDFAKYGHPGEGVAPIDIVKRRYFVINQNITVKENYDPKMMAFWNEYLPEIAKLNGKKNDVSSSPSKDKQIGTFLFLAAMVLISIMLV